MERNKGLHFSAERERERGGLVVASTEQSAHATPTPGWPIARQGLNFYKTDPSFPTSSVVTVMVVLDPVSPLLSEEKFQQRQASLTCHGQATKPFQNLQATLSERLGLPLYLV